ncbi:MAG: hypothetical protein ACRDH5_17170, partial [bacterium]
MKRSSRVSEPVPVQVYLRPAERARLERLAAELKASRADVLRRGLEVLERLVLDPEHHPLLKLAGVGRGGRGPEVHYDVAVEHDRYLADVLPARWGYSRLA